MGNTLFKTDTPIMFTPEEEEKIENVMATQAGVLHQITHRTEEHKEYIQELAKWKFPIWVDECDPNFDSYDTETKESHKCIKKCNNMCRNFVKEIQENYKDEFEKNFDNFSIDAYNECRSKFSDEELEKIDNSLDNTRDEEIDRWYRKLNLDLKVCHALKFKENAFDVFAALEEKAAERIQNLHFDEAYAAK